MFRSAKDQGWQFVTIALLASLLAAVPTAATGVRAAIARGDGAWESRHLGHRGLKAAPGPIGEAIAGYSEALDADPRNLEARWKLVRAIYYQGEHVLADRDERLTAFERARLLGEQGIDQLAEQVGGRAALDRMSADEVGRALAMDPEAPGIYFWTAANWGLWGRLRGKFAAARKGVAGKVRDYTEIAVVLDERFDEGGPHRVLGRLHAEAPWIPFITGWVDRQKAIRELERSLELVPESILGELYLVEALHDFDRSRREEALERLRKLVDRPPHPDYVVEDLNALENARTLLAEWSG